MKNVAKKSKKVARIRSNPVEKEEVVSSVLETSKENELSLNKNRENLFKLLKVLADIDERLAGHEAFRYIQDILSLIINDKNKEQKMEILSLLTKFIMGE